MPQLFVRFSETFNGLVSLRSSDNTNSEGRASPFRETGKPAAALNSSAVLINFCCSFSMAKIDHDRLIKEK